MDRKSRKNVTGRQVHKVLTAVVGIAVLLSVSSPLAYTKELFSPYQSSFVKLLPSGNEAVQTQANQSGFNLSQVSIQDYRQQSTKQINAQPNLQTDAREKFLLQQLEEDTTAAATDSTSGSGDVPALKGSVTSLRVTKGRSQIIKFAQPISRISIADPSLANLIPLAPDQIMINGNQRGVTSLIVWDENGQEGIFDLYVQNDTSELLRAVEAIAPNEKIDVRVTDDSFVISGQISNTVILGEIQQVAAAYGYREANFINLTETPAPQVLLEAKFAEASRGTVRNLRTSFGMTYNGDTLQVTRLLNDGNIAVGSIPNGVATAAGGLAGRINPLNATFDFLESNGDIMVLAEPTLVAAHGEKALLRAGGTFPVQNGTDQNGNAIIDFKDFGVELEFTPRISVRSGRIELNMRQKVSDIDCTRVLGTTCGTRERESTTVVELKDGETLMISGLSQRQETNNAQKVPLLHQVPVVGNLFKNVQKSKEDVELILVITPHIIQPNRYGKVLGGVT